jgi:uncharacterized protein (TIGR02266 family)
MSASSENKRRASRLEHELPVAYRSVGSFLTDWATNISQGGMFINSRKPLPVGTGVRILLQLPSLEFPLGLSGKVTRVVEPGSGKGSVPGMGIEFTDVDPSRRAQLESIVTRLQRDLES